MTEISKYSIIEKCDGFLESDIGEESVMMREEDGFYFEMNKTGKNIWQAFEGTISVEGLCANLTNKYNIDQKTCFDEVVVFLTALHKAGAVNVS